MDPVGILVAIGLIAFGIYMIRIGLLMVVNPKYRHHITTLWFKKKSQSEEKKSEEGVKFVGGPMYILFGGVFVYFGISLLFQF